MDNNKILETKLAVYESCDNGSITQDEKKYLLNILNYVENHEYESAFELMRSHTEFSSINDTIMREVTNVLRELDDVLYERSVTLNLPTMNFGVYGNGKQDRGFGNDPYFKIYNGKAYKTSNKIARISFTRAEYIIHNGESWILSGSEKKILMDYLTNNIVDGKNLWNRLIDEAETVLEDLKDNSKYSGWIEKLENCRNTMPDYSKITKPKKNK